MYNIKKWFKSSKEESEKERIPVMKKFLMNSKSLSAEGMSWIWQLVSSAATRCPNCTSMLDTADVSEK